MRPTARNESPYCLRPGLRSDAEALIQLVDGVYREYGDEVHLAGYDADLLDVESAYEGEGGAFRVLEYEGEIVGAHATKPIDLDEGVVTFRRLYLPREHRGTGAGVRLMDWALAWSRDHGFKRVEFWSDVRFERAHRFFGRYRFARGGIRHVEDGPLSFSEYHFSLDLAGARDGS